MLNAEAIEIPHEEIRAIEIAVAEQSLLGFIEQAWHVVEPKTPFRSGWHLEAICEHLQAITYNQINRLIINMPPRHMKSLAVSVFWPVWEWGPASHPETKWLFSTYAETLSKRDSLKCRRLLQHHWFQERWNLQLRYDQNEKLRFENVKSGYRIATSVMGLGTGEGGDRIVVDDPHNVLEAESIAKRVQVITWWDESMSTRLNDELTGAKVIVMQRVHDKDLTGHVLSKERGYVHLCLPARYEGTKRLKTPLMLEDPRTKIGEPLWPAKFPEEVLAKRESEMTEYAIASQHQQRPQPRGGGMFKVDKFKLVNDIPKNEIVKSVRYWDKAATEGGGAFSCGVLMHKMLDGSYCVADVVKGQWSAGTREARMKQTAELDGIEVEIWLEQEGGSGGKESAEESIKNLAGYRVKAERPTGSKVVRAEPFAAQVEIGNVTVLNRSWTAEYLEACEKFPMASLKDEVDSSSGAFNKLAKAKVAGVWGR